MNNVKDSVAREWAASVYRVLRTAPYGMSSAGLSKVTSLPAWKVLVGVSFMRQRGVEVVVVSMPDGLGSKYCLGGTLAADMQGFISDKPGVSSDKAPVIRLCSKKIGHLLHETSRSDGFPLRVLLRCSRCPYGEVFQPITQSLRIKKRIVWVETACPSGLDASLCKAMLVDAHSLYGE